MKLIFLYGPPAVGKLTVARELAKLTNYKVFHNHLTFDLVEAVFEFGSKPFNETVDKYRLDLIETAARYKVGGVIFTIVYAKGHDEKFIRKVMRAIEKYKGEVNFVQMYCEHRELFKRLKNPSRKKFSKMKKTKTLREIINKYELFSSVPYKKNLVIDNTELSARVTAQKIKNYFKLKKVKDL